MIKNNLAKLLIDRNIKATRLAKDTGIARSTISKIANNQTGKIDFSTLNILCSYLKITPQQFFDYIPIDFEYNVQFNDTMIFKDDNGFLSKETECNFDFFIDIKDHRIGKQETVCMNGTVKINEFGFTASITLKYDTDSDKETFEHYQNEIEFAFYPIIKKDIKTYLTVQISTELGDFTNCYFSVPDNFIDTHFVI